MGRPMKKPEQKARTAGFSISGECYEMYRKLAAEASGAVRQTVREFAEQQIKAQYGLYLLAVGEKERKL